MQQQLNIEESLVKEGIISASQLQTLKLEQQRSAVTLVEAIHRLKFVPEDVLIDFLCKKLRLVKFNLADFTPPKEILQLLPADFTWKYRVVPLSREHDELVVGLIDPLNTALLEELRFRTGLFIKPQLVREDELNDALIKYYDRRKTKRAEGAGVSVEAAVKEVSEPTIVEAVNLLLLQAARVNASDIHIEPQEGKMRIHLRVDGVLKEISPFEQDLYNVLVSRIKIMSNMDIAERRLPQDGRFKIDLEEGSIDVRVSVIPTIQGESVVLRLLRQNKKLLTMQELGMAKENFSKYLRLIQRPSGIVLVTGPTGSGKTTTLYASLMIIKSAERNIITIEDPVEYQLDFCRQIQVNPKVNLLFSTGLRSILRHDPDIIMVGEIRDRETAEIAIQAALTGHLVLSTLHTNDAASAVTRLIDMGIEPFLIASCLNGVVAQRLLRVLCPKCKKPMGEEALKNSSFKIPKEITEDQRRNIYQAQGCQNCLHTGFAGRVGIYEIMEMEPQIGRLTVEKASSEQISSYCRSKGMESLYDDGWKKVASGTTSPQELMRILGA
ncbi:MAG: GspE/PulE family protein [Candidatus Omnitrophica bacterium]|nr:GspE/PulE family protein [Candidatus Omnitrophota bacterium]MDD5553817.1 GspE/PulE family protein [Candidatus Omnitrophota bacterium]